MGEGLLVSSRVVVTEGTVEGGVADAFAAATGLLAVPPFNGVQGVGTYQSFAGHVSAGSVRAHVVGKDTSGSGGRGTGWARS